MKYAVNNYFLNYFFKATIRTDSNLFFYSYELI